LGSLFYPDRNRTIDNVTHFKASVLEKPEISAALPRETLPNSPPVPNLGNA
jgi:hypothetical protein